MLDTAINFFTIGASLVAGFIAGLVGVWLAVMVIAFVLIAVFTFIAALFSK